MMYDGPSTTIIVANSKSTTNPRKPTKSLQKLLLFTVLFTSLFVLIGPSKWHHRRHRHGRLSRSFSSGPDSPSPAHHRRRAHPVAFPTFATPALDFQFTAPSYNLSVHENSIGQRAVASNPGSTQMVGVWLPRGYNQISFRIVEGDKQGRFTVSAKRLGNFAFVQLEHRDQMDVLNRELQSEYSFTIRAIAKRKKANTMEASTTVHLRVLDENDNPPMFKELSYQVDVDTDVLLNSPLIRLEAFDADEGLNGALYYSLVDPSPYFYIEPSTGLLRNFAPLASLSSSNLSLDVRIEDRASRLSFHSRQKGDEEGDNGDGGPSGPLQFIRNRAKVELVISRRKEPQKPTISFHQLPFPPILGDPVMVGTVRIGGSDPDGVHLDIAPRQNSPNVSNCAWMERRSAEEAELWICGPFPVAEYEEKLEVRVKVARTVDKLTGKQIEMGEEVLVVGADPAQRMVKMQEVPEGTIDILESMPAGSMIWQFRAVASWPKDQQRIRFSLQKHSYTEFPFVLDKRTGQLRVRTPLDFERAKIQEWDISVLGQLENLQSMISVKLRLLDINDHCPEFAQIPLGHRISLTEQQLNPKTPSEGIVWRAKATDRDSGKNGEVVYKLVEEGEDGQDKLEKKMNMFNIDALTGEIRLTGNWSFSFPNGSDQQLRIRVLAMDRGWPIPLQTQLRLIIQRGTTKTQKPNIQNLGGPEWLQSVCQMDNKHRPEFVKPNNEQGLIGEVQETAPPGTVIGQVLAEDGDEVGPNGFVQYWMDPESDADGHFGVEQFSGKVFLQRWAALGELLENTKNEGGNGLQDYIEHVLTIIASDLAFTDRKNISRQFRVRIFGANSHSPVFDQPGYRVRIPEGNSPGIELIQLRARDPDLGRNGRVEFRLAVETDLVTVDPDSGLVRAGRMLDREELGDQIRLLVMALDRGTPSRATFANLTILLSDVNDEAPQCGREMYRFSIPEDAPNGQMIGCLSAFDRDMPGSPNSELNFQLHPEPENTELLPFRIDSETGCLFLFSNTSGHPLNFEQHSAYNLSVSLRDRGRPPLESKDPCQVQVLLEDVDENLHPPQFPDIALEANVEENAPAGTEVIRVRAEDPEASQIRYRLVGGSGFGWFRIDPFAGTIHTTKEIDYEQHQQFWLTVQAEDSPSRGGGRTLRAHMHVFVRVLNQNDRLPLFTQPFYRVAIAENSEENKVILKVEAMDADDQWVKQNQQNDRLKYSIVRGNPQSHFQIDEHTGYLVTGKRRLDREAQSEHELVVQACDQGQLCSTATVLVIVEDLNDNAPQFDARQLDQLVIPEDRRGPFGRVFATDADAPGSANSRVRRYWLAEGADPRIEMDEEGRLSAREPIKAGTELPEMTVWAEDGGNPPLRENATFRLGVVGRSGLRASNRAPNLLRKEEWREMEVAEGAPQGTLVVGGAGGGSLIRAEDPDGDTLWWTVTGVEGAEPEGRDPFAFRRVEGKSAELVVAEQIQSSGKPGERGERRLIVHFALTDGMDTINDQLVVRIRPSALVIKPRPQFEQIEHTVELPSHLPVGLVLYQPKVRMDAQHGGPEVGFGHLSHPQRLQFSLHSADDLAALVVFRVEPATGNVFLEQPLPERLASPFTLVLSASLTGSADVAGFAVVHMKRRAENRHAPQFLGMTESRGEQQQIMVQMEEHIGPGDLIYIVEAIDPDLGQKEGISYSLLSGNDQKLFVLNASNGELRLAKQLPHHFNETLLTIRATDSPPAGHQPKWAKCQLRIMANGRRGLMRRGPMSESEMELGGITGPGKKRIMAPKFIAPSAIQPSNTFFAFSEKSQTEECGKILNIHFATGQITLIKDTVTEEALLNCTVELRRTTESAEIVIEQTQLAIKISPTLSAPLRFSATEFHGEIEENAPPGSPVLSRASDSSGPLQLSVRHPLRHSENILRFRLLSPLDTHFMVDTASGTVRCLDPLDFEQHPEWHFFVLAQHSPPSSPPVFIQPALIKIRIRNVDDEAPVFTRDMPEMLQIVLPNIVGSPIGHLHTTDPDSVQLTYSLIKNPSDLFTIEKEQGIIRTIGNDSNLLALRQNTIQLEAIVSDGRHISSPLGIKIQMENTTNLPLRFAQPIYNLNLKENQTERTLLLSLWSPKARLGEQIQFELLASAEAEKAGWITAFEIEPLTGLLWVDTRKYKLDRETTPKLEFLIRAKNGKRTVAQSLVEIQLEDINDSAPEFAQAEYNASISEAAKAGDRIMTIRARDNDTGMNGVVRYSLDTDVPPFVELNKYDGKMTVSAAISDQKLAIGQMFRFEVHAIDRGAPALSSTVSISLRVVHRYQPIFSQQIYTVIIASETNGKNPLATVRAWSNAPNSQIGYRITDGDHRREFRMNFDKGQLLLTAPYEMKFLESEYKLTIEATDITRRGSPPAHAQIHLQFRLPKSETIQFDKQLFRWTIPENSRAVNPLLTMPNGVRNVSSIRLLPETFSDFKFALASQNGLVQLHMDNVDFEQCPFLQIGLELYQQNDTTRKQPLDKAMAQVTVTDGNDNAPEFIETGPVEIDVWWSATDPPQPIQRPQYLHKFRVNDRDTVTAKNSNNKQLEYQIVPNPGSAPIPSFIRLDPSTGVLSAHWGSLIGSAQSSSSSAQFWPLPPDQPLRFNISASDGIHTAQLGVILRLANVDDLTSQNNNLGDNSLLQFDQSLYTWRLSKMAPIGMSLGTVRSRGGNAPYKFRIGAKWALASGGWPIELDPDTGRVILASNSQARHTPTPLLVEDAQGRRAHAQFQLMPMEPGDDNVHSPRWIAPKNGYDISLDLGANLPNDQVLQVLAVDDDAGDRLEYQIVGNAETERLFQLNSNSGMISLRKIEEAQFPGSLTFSVRVSDSGNPPHQSEIPVRIRLLPPPPSGKAPPFSRVPRFGQLRYFFALPEDTPVGQQLSQLQQMAENGNDGLGIFGGKARFSIVESSDPADSAPFAMDPTTGQLSLRRPLDSEQRRSHHFLVRLELITSTPSDEPTPGSLALVSVSVLDFNDSPPEFVSAPLDDPITVSEKAAPGTVMAPFVARDADIDETNFALVYSIETDQDDADTQVDWTIDTDQGWLRVGPGGLDRERRSDYSLRVVASDSGGLRAVQPVRIRVRDANDSPPRFGHSLYKLNMSLDITTQLGQTLLRFDVSDLDEMNPDEELQIILLDDHLDIFQIIEKKHTLVLNRIPSNREIKDLKQPYTVRVAVYDGLYSDYAQLETQIHMNFSPNDSAPSSPELHCRRLFGDQMLKIAGNLPPGHPIFEWDHNEFRVELLGSADMVRDSFQLRNHSALVTLADYHRSPQFTLRAIVHQKRFGNEIYGCKQSLEELACVQTLQIQVENANRMAPKFPSPELTLNVSEHAYRKDPNLAESEQAITVLTRLEAIDTDSGEFGQLRYSILGQEGTAKSPFWIDPESGVLGLIGELDREERDRWEVEVRAEDGGGLQGGVRVQVRVQDENDNAPECTQPLVQAQLLENDPNGLDLQLEATDRDQHRHPGGFLFKLPPDTPPELARALRVSSNGRIQLAPDTSLDFEQWTKKAKRAGPAALIEFGVEVHDRGEPVSLKGICRVQIVLLDMNDNAPIFERPLYEAEIRENAPEGTKILQLLATDLDSEHFGHVSYSMESAQLIQLKENNQTELIGPMLNQTDLAEYFTLGDQDGWLKIAVPLDFEQVGEDRLIQLRILALDGGDPPLSGHTLVQLRILDQNDNPPRVSDCANLNALVQEGVAPGSSLLSLAISDVDSAGNAGPFRVQLSGPGADAFAVDPMLNVITTRQLTFAQNREFLLELRAYDAGGLVSDPCLLRIRVQPQSRHAPTIHSLSIQLMALHGEYLGGPLGKLLATDRDPSDQLRFSVISDSRPHSPPQFSVNSDTGDLFASGDLLPGLHLFNVSVTDGKFVAIAPISVNVVKVDQEKLDNSLSIRIRGVGIEVFVHKYMRRFVELLARLLAVRSTNVYILAMQEIQQQLQQQSSQMIPKASKEMGNGIRRRRRHRRPKRNGPIQKQGMAPKETVNLATIDILLTIQRPEGTVGGGAMYHRPSYVKQRLEAGMGPLFVREAPELEILSMITEVCRRDTCPRGECRDRLWLDNAKLQTVHSNGSTTAFVGPMHVRTFECICRQGYAGANCDVPVNKCSKELCRRVEMCIPSSISSFSSSPSDSANNVGFNCACPPGFRGPTCSDRICANQSPVTLTECQRQHEAISLLGNGYFELHLAASVESRMELSVEFRTISSHAVLMHGAGLHDHHTLRIIDGMIHYLWDCGTGEGMVRVSGTRVDDGLWHQIRVLRIGRLSRLTLDDKYRAEGTSPPGSDVLNLFQHSALLVFGARVSPSPQSLAQFADSFVAANSPRGNNKLLTADELRVQIGEGMVGCIGRVAMDGGTAPQGSKTATGLGALRLFGVTIGCDERTLGPCLNAPCQNGGQCVPASSGTATANLSPNESSAFTCSCPPRFTGARCEIDLNACAAHPCPNGIPCHNLYGDFHCSCPAGFTGKTCQLRGDWDPCVTASCGPNGQCVRLPGNSFNCLCAPGFSGPQCSDPSPTELTDPRGTDSNGSADWFSDLIRSPQFALLLVVCVLSLLCTVLAIFICRRRSSRVNQRNGWRNRAKAKGKVATNGGTGSVGSRNRNGTGTGSGSGTRNPNRNGGRREDPACSLLVPKETAAPGQGTADRPPPPLPPRYHRRNANGHSSALPTVEVRPMPAKKENVAKQLDEKKKSEKQGPPVPPPRDSSSSADQQTCSNSNDAALRAFGRCLEQDELRKYNLSGEGGTNKEEGGVNNGQKNTGEVVEQQSQPKGSYGRKIERACSVAANTQKQKVTAKKAPPEHSKAKDGEDNYLTMKPVHRAKPFSRLARDEGESAPPPPMHRTPLLNPRGRNPGTSSMKMYESPVDALDDGDGEAGGGGGTE